jgi:cell pole-organizing protein PopZ
MTYLAVADPNRQAPQPQAPPPAVHLHPLGGRPKAATSRQIREIFTALRIVIDLRRTLPLRQEFCRNPQMDDTDGDVGPTPHVAGVSIVPPEHPVVDKLSKTGLLSHETSAAVGSAFNTLTQAVRKQNSQTLEDLVREILRPRLEFWLDDNLSGLVERMVRTEIERIAREH